MRAYVLDLESVPKPEAELLELMPPELRYPVMPEAIKNPPPVDLSKCPVYGGDEVKQDNWKAKQINEWQDKTEAARSAWEEKAIEAKQRFIDDAALSPVTGTVKLIGIKDVITREAYIFVCGASKAQADALLNPLLKPAIAIYPCPVIFRFYNTETEMLTVFSTAINSGAVIPGSNDQESDHKLIGYYTHWFDFQFIFKRCWILGAVVPWMLRKGRYWRDEVTVDLYDIFNFYDRSQKSGGMDAIAKILGTRRKSGTGEFFYRLWESDPVAAVLYLIDDLGCVEEAATKMGVIRPVKGVK